MGRGAWWAAVHGVAKSRTRLRDLTFTFHFHALEKEMAAHSSVLAWRIPGAGEPGGLPSMGSHRVGHNRSNLAAAMIFSSDENGILYLYMPTSWKNSPIILCRFVIRELEMMRISERPWALLGIHIIVDKGKLEAGGLGENLGFSSSSCWTSCKIHKRFKPQFSHLQNGDENRSPSS